jgi:hypothetical protein
MKLQLVVNNRNLQFINIIHLRINGKLYEFDIPEIYQNGENWKIIIDSSWKWDVEFFWRIMSRKEDVLKVKPIL